MRTITGALFLFLISTEVLQAIEVRLEISSPVAAIGEPVYVQVHINDAAGVDCVIEFPPTPAFTRRDAGVSQNHSVRIINSRVERSSTWIRNFLFVPQQAGRFVLGPATCKIGGRVLTTQTVTLDVTATSANRPPVRNRRGGLFDFFDNDPMGGQEEEETEVRLETSFDRGSVWAGEQVVHYVDILATRQSLINVEFAQIQRHGFWEVQAEPRQQPKPERIERQGRDWFRYRYIAGYLFPLTSGQKSVDPFAVRVHYDRFWPKSVVLQSGKLELSVRDLPRDPEGLFSGAVGSFKLEETLEPAGGYVCDQPFVMTLILSGEGNVRAAGEPQIPATTNFRFMQPQIDTEVRAIQGRMHGIRRWKYLVYPLTPGEVRVPEIRFRVFDPQKGAWMDLSRPGKKILVRGKGDLAAGTGSHGSDAQDIPFLVPPRGDLPVPISLPAAVAILSPAALWLLIACLLARAERRREADLPGYARRTAGKTALAGLAALKDETEIPAGVEKVLREYAVRRTNAPPGGTTESLRILLERDGVDPVLLSRWKDLLDQAATLRYGGQGVDPKQLLDEARRAIASMESLK
ncbi:MAG TPA: BatD family protein [Spirochaetota bacterium]|nr:BatD family protein [Spirochaetota bacterium]